MDISLSHPTVSRFSWIVEGLRRGPDAIFDRVLMESPSFVAVPTKGSLVAGWCLVVPRRRLINLAGLSEAEKQELACFRRDLTRRLARNHISIFEFEHGANRIGSVTGCGVDQAHLHVVPLGFDLPAAIARQEPLSVLSEDAVDLWGGVDEREYVLVRNASESATYGLHPKAPTSQFVRKVIASELGIADHWDYRSHPVRANALATIERLQN